MKSINYLFVLPSLLAISLFASQAQAGFISGVSAGAGFGPGGNGDFTAATNIVTGAEGAGDFSGAIGTNPNFIALNLETFALNESFELNFTVAPATVAPAFPTETDYSVFVFMTNSLHSMKEINGMDIELVGIVPGTFVSFDIATPHAFSEPDTGEPGIPLAFENPNLPLGGIRFGGLSGGGGGIPFGATHILAFSVDVVELATGVPPGAGFSLRFTANPEPEAIALGMFTLAIGGFFVYRRRSQKLKIQTEAAAQMA